MNDAKHTPGPWRVTESNLRKVVSDSLDGFDPLAGENVIGGAWTGPRAYANARLIAAAPDLLEALEDALSGWHYIRTYHGDLYGVGWVRVENAATAAIAKAKGQTP